MNSFEEILYMLQDKMETPVAWGWFHLMWIGISVLVLIFLKLRKKYTETELKLVLGIYGITALVLEVTKQLYGLLIMMLLIILLVGIINGMQHHFNYVQHLYLFL